MKKHRFRFSKESKDRVEHFDAAEKQDVNLEKEAEETAAPVPEQPAVLTVENDANTAAAAPTTEDEPFVVVTRTDIGKMRATNQDAVIYDGLICGVADGMGGHKGGETASAGARDQLIELLREREPDPGVLVQAIKSVNRKLFLRQLEDENLTGMGTTLTVLWVGAENIYVGHVGDSRCYLLREGEMKQITDDHSLVMEMVRAGALTKEQAAVHPMKNVITRAVGTEEGVEVDLITVERKPGDVWLVCSDGLHGMVPETLIQELLSANPPEKAADLLMQAALDAGGRDNITLTILKDQEGE